MLKSYAYYFLPGINTTTLTTSRKKIALESIFFLVFEITRKIDNQVDSLFISNYRNNGFKSA